MKWAGMIVASVAVTLAQMSWWPALRPMGVVPNMALVFIVLVSLEGTASTGLMLAVGMGCVLDIISGGDFGLWTGILVLAALAAGLLHRAGWELEGGLTGMAMVMAGTLLMAVVVWVQLAASVDHWPAAELARRVGLEVMLNLVLIVVMRPLIRWLLSGSQAGVMKIG